MRKTLGLIILYFSVQCVTAQFTLTLGLGAEIAIHGAEVKCYELGIFNDQNAFNYGFGIRRTTHSKISSSDFTIILPAQPYEGEFEEQGKISSTEFFLSSSIKVKKMDLNFYWGICASPVKTIANFQLWESSRLVETINYEKVYDLIIYQRVGLGLQYAIRFDDKLRIVPKIQLFQDLKPYDNDYHLISNNEITSEVVDDIKFAEGNPRTKTLFHENNYLTATISLFMDL